MVVAKYAHCVAYYKGGKKKGKCKDFAAGGGRKKKSKRKTRRKGTITGKVCIQFHRTKPKRCKKYGTKAEARARGV